MHPKARPPAPRDPLASMPETFGSCPNCGAPLYGKYCYACGQPTEGLVRHFGSVLSDVTDSVFNIDERLFKTLAPLYFKPGKLTLDYFAGKRARYVTPFRLVFFLAIVAFFGLQLTVRSGFSRPALIGIGVSSSGHVAVQRNDGNHDNGAFAHRDISINGHVLWNRETRPLRIGWLPRVANEWLNALIGNAQANLRAMNSGNPAEAKLAARRMILGMFAAAPTILFVLLPVFALLLKIFYVFKRRLYMEHLIVAMHSHAFLMLSMLVLLALGVLRHLLQPHAAWVATPFDLLDAAAWIWIFVYLFRMQKRVYGQGWIMTTLKYWWIGFFYTMIAGIGFVFVSLIGLTGA